jgi:hypothetical protein
VHKRLGTGVPDVLSQQLSIGKNNRLLKENTGYDAKLSQNHS